MVSRNQKWPKLPVFEDDGFVDMIGPGSLSKP